MLSPTVASTKPAPLGVGTNCEAKVMMSKSATVLRTLVFMPYNFRSPHRSMYPPSQFAAVAMWSLSQEEIGMLRYDLELR